MERQLKQFLKNPQSSRMFNFVTLTWNPVVGCKHLCKYCWARKLALTKLVNSHRYKDGFKPKLIEKELQRKFRKNELVFVSDMGDLFGDWVPKDWIKKVLECIKNNPQTIFLLLTKNPKRYLEFVDEFPPNCILGITIETNKDIINTKKYSEISIAPKPSERIKWIKKLRKKWNGFLMIAIEPIMDFDFELFYQFIKEILPTFVVIGKDNYKNNLPEPPDEKIEKFIEEINKITTIVIKKSLEKFTRKSKKIFTVQELIPKIQVLKMENNPQLLKKLISVSNKFCEFEKWTPLKLISLSYIISPYLRIVDTSLKKKYGSKMCITYIDLFAGCGLNKIEKNVILGSPLLSIEKCKHVGKFFDKFYFIEREPTLCKALKKRLEVLEEENGYEWLKERYKIIVGNSNLKINEIINELSSTFEKVNSLAFIDPYKWEIEWETLENIFQLYGDFLMICQPLLIAKEIGKYNKGSLTKKTIQEISKYFGEKPEVWSKLITENKVKEFYINKIRRFGIRHLETIHIKSGKGAYSYYLIFGSKTKKQNPPWWSLVKTLKEFIESYNGNIVNDSFKITTGEIKTLWHF